MKISQIIWNENASSFTTINFGRKPRKGGRPPNDKRLVNKDILVSVDGWMSES